MKRETGDAAAGGRGAVNFGSRQSIAGGPFVNLAASGEEFEFRCAIIGVEIFDVYVVISRIAMELKSRSARAGGGWADNCLAARGCFPRRDVLRDVAVKFHCFGFDAAGKMSGSAFFIRDSGCAQEPIADGVAPDLSGSGLIFELLQNFGGTLRV